MCKCACSRKSATALGPYRGGPSVRERLKRCRIRYVRCEGSQTILIAEAGESAVVGPYWQAVLGLGSNESLTGGIKRLP